MKITVKNLGAVNEAEIDLKPLTVFVGHNSTGKTWTAYTLASVFSPYGHRKYLESYIDGKTQQTYPVLDKAIEEFIQEGSAEIDIVQFAQENIQAYINDVACLAPGWMRSYLSTRRVNFEDLSIEINLHTCEMQLIEKIKTVSSYGNLSISSRELNFFKEEDSKQVFFSMESKKKTDKKIPIKIVKRFIYAEIFEILHRAFFFNTRLFPTERTTFITLPICDGKGRGADDSDQTEVSDALSFIHPISSFTGMISAASSVFLDDRKEGIEETPQIKDYMDLAVFLEERIIQGKGDFEESGIDKELLFSTGNLKLEMGITSSMIKEIMPLVLYLRYLAEPNDLIVIDEPEMNLHPAAQVEIIEFLSMLVNAGLNVLITTHSPYIVDHISNLIEAKKHQNPEEIKQYFYLEDDRAFIGQDKVSVHLFEDNTTKNILAEDGSINWETFWNVSSDISGIYSQLLKTKKA
ncbi:MAG: AAA family ATPase [Methylococcaceae bacterium]